MVTVFFPSKNAVERFRDKVRKLTCKATVGLKDTEQLVLGLNRLIVGWSNYFNHSDAYQTYKRLQRFIEWKFVGFMRFKHQRRRRFSMRFGGLWECYRYGLTKLGLEKYRNRIYPKYHL